MSETAGAGRPRIVLICHAESRLNRDGIARWLASFTDLVGIVLIEEDAAPSALASGARSGGSGCGVSSTCSRSGSTTAAALARATHGG